MRTVIAALESVTESMLNLYSKRSGQPREAIRALMASEKWFHAQEAVDQGFADEVRGVVKAAAMIDAKRVSFGDRIFDLSQYHNVPAAFSATTAAEVTTTQTERENMTPNAESPTPSGSPPTPSGTPPANPPDQPKPSESPPPQPKPSESPPTQNDLQRGITQERERVAALLKLDKPSTHSIIEAAIRDGKSVTDVLPEILNAIESGAVQSARIADASVVNGIPPSGVQMGDGGQTFGTWSKNKVKDRMKTSRFSPLRARAGGRN
jgi:hypothetical protein